MPERWDEHFAGLGAHKDESIMYALVRSYPALEKLPAEQTLLIKSFTRFFELFEKNKSYIANMAHRVCATGGGILLQALMRLWKADYIKILRTKKSGNRDIEGGGSDCPSLRAQRSNPAHCGSRVSDNI